LQVYVEGQTCTPTRRQEDFGFQLASAGEDQVMNENTALSVLKKDQLVKTESFEKRITNKLSVVEPRVTR
jgi:hypothetical protein